MNGNVPGRERLDYPLGYHEQMRSTQATGTIEAPAQLERRGRWWLIVSFLACPCHLPLTLGFLAVVLGGTAFGAIIRDHALLAGIVITSVWIAGTGRGLWLIRQAERNGYACPLPDSGPD